MFYDHEMICYEVTKWLQKSIPKTFLQSYVYNPMFTPYTPSYLNLA